jgi:hypothetical protein
VAISKRERYIGIGVGVTLGLLVVDHFVLSPYMDRSKLLDSNLQQVEMQEKSAASMLDAKIRMEKTWTQLRKNMKAEAPDADSQARTALRECADAAGVNLGDVNPDRSAASQEGFRLVNLRVSASGRTASISRMLWQLETLPIPLRINSLELSSRPENSDDLRLEMNVSTLVSPQDITRGGNTQGNTGGSR